MNIVFDYKREFPISNKEVFSIWKRIMRKYNIFYKVSMVFMATVFVAFVLLLFDEWDWSFLFVGAVLAYVYIIYKRIPTKVKGNMQKMPNFIFQDEYYYVGEKQFQYSDIEVLEMGGDFVRIKAGNYKLILFFKNRDEQEIDMLVAKLKANAKQYKEV